MAENAGATQVARTGVLGFYLIQLFSKYKTFAILSFTLIYC